MSDFVDGRPFRKNLIGEYTPMQVTIRSLTNNDPWGVKPADMQEVCDRLDNPSDRNDVLVALRERLSSKESSWRNIYKSLILYEYFILHASPAYVVFMRNSAESLADDQSCLESLATTFEYLDEKGKDQGINVRTRAAAVLALLTGSSSELEGARVNALANKATMKERKYNAEVSMRDAAGAARVVNKREDSSWPPTGTTNDAEPGLASNEPTPLDQGGRGSVSSSEPYSALVLIEGLEEPSKAPSAFALAPQPPAEDESVQEDEFDEFQGAPPRSSTTTTSRDDDSLSAFLGSFGKDMSSFEM